MRAEVEELGDHLVSLSFEELVQLRDYIIEEYGFTMKCLEMLVGQKCPLGKEEWEVYSEMYHNYMMSHVVTAGAGSGGAESAPEHHWSAPQANNGGLCP